MKLVKLILWLLYISALSSLIAGIWIINTLNIVGTNLQIKLGDYYIYPIISMNILIFCIISYAFFNSMVEFVVTIH